MAKLRRRTRKYLTGVGAALVLILILPAAGAQASQISSTKVALAQSVGSSLDPGEFMNVGDTLEYGRYRLALQPGGNLILYWGTYAIWATNTSNGSNPSPVTRLNLSNSSRLSIQRANGTELWARGPYPGQNGLFLAYNGDLRIGNGSGWRNDHHDPPTSNTGWRSGSSDIKYDFYTQDDSDLTYCFESGVTPRIRQGYSISMSHSLPQTKLESYLLPCQNAIDIQVRYGGNQFVNQYKFAYALTTCSIMYAGGTTCDSGMTAYNPAVPYFENYYGVLTCHETGHLLSMNDYDAEAEGAASNDEVLEDDRNCMRDQGFVVKYSKRQIVKIDYNTP